MWRMLCTCPANGKSFLCLILGLYEIPRVGIECPPANTRSTGQPGDNLVHDRVSTGGDFLWSLVLDGVRNVDGVEVGAAQRGCLGARSGHELVGGDRYRRDP